MTNTFISGVALGLGFFVGSKLVDGLAWLIRTLNEGDDGGFVPPGYVSRSND